MIDTSEVYNSLQSINIYQNVFGGINVTINIPKREGFFGVASKNGQSLFKVFSHTDLYRVVNSINIFLSEKKYESYNVRFKTMQTNTAKPQGIVNEQRVFTRTQLKVNAIPKPQNLGNTQTKVSFDWGSNV